MYNGLFLPYKFMFANTTSVEIVKPSRAEYPKSKIFIAQIAEELQISIPFNAPVPRPDRSHPPYFVNFAREDSTEKLYLRHATELGKTLYVPSSVYWTESGTVNMPFLPFFSNCKGYGQHIPIWSIFEQHFNCTIIPYEETLAISQFGFGKDARADSCALVKIDCLYDEIFAEKQPESRWFEITSGSVLFNIPKIPVTAEELKSKEFNEMDLIPIFTKYSRVDSRVVPKIVRLKISYYQMDQNMKSLVNVQMFFDEYQALDDDQFNGVTTVDYALKIEYFPLTHRQLMIAFAFDWTFYMVLYFVVGFASILIAVIFLVYHKICSRNTKAKYKFFSYIWLKLPPSAAGMSYAILPIMILVFLIVILYAGHLW